jgi:hypothetical protein
MSSTMLEWFRLCEVLATISDGWRARHTLRNGCDYQLAVRYGCYRVVHVHTG